MRHWVRGFSALGGALIGALVGMSLADMTDLPSTPLLVGGALLGFALGVWVGPAVVELATTVG